MDITPVLLQIRVHAGKRAPHRSPPSLRLPRRSHPSAWVYLVSVIAQTLLHRRQAARNLPRPAYLAVLGVTAYRAAFEEPKAALGEQQRTIGTTRLWVLPNPSGLNAHYQPAALAALFAELRGVVRASVGGR